jgi:threonine-phosphate decarboxylase
MTDRSVPAHGGQLHAIAARFGVPEESLLDFSASINPAPPSDELVEALCASIRARSVIARYPDTNYTALKRAIAEYAGVDEHSICVGNGGMSLLLATIRALGVRRCLVLVPAFLEYERVLASCGVERIPFALREEEDFAIDSQRVLDQLEATQADLLLLANPHSPSGRLLPCTALEELQRSASALGVYTIVDEAFIDYEPGQALSRQAAGARKLVVLRSLTKFFAMPGLRVGYAIAHLELRARLEATLPLWPVDSIAAEAASLALRDITAIEATRENNRKERGWLSDQLRCKGLTVFPAAANYLLFKIGDSLDGLALWRQLIVKHGIVIRSCANFEGLDTRHFRVAVRTRAENQRLITALSDSLSGE